MSLSTLLNVLATQQVRRFEDGDLDEGRTRIGVQQDGGTARQLLGDCRIFAEHVDEEIIARQQHQQLLVQRDQVDLYPRLHSKVKVFLCGDCVSGDFLISNEDFILTQISLYYILAQCHGSLGATYSTTLPHRCIS